MRIARRLALFAYKHGLWFPRFMQRLAGVTMWRTESLCHFFDGRGNVHVSVGKGRGIAPTNGIGLPSMRPRKVEGS